MNTPGYYIRFRGKVEGPYDIATLQKMARRGVISRIHEISGDRSRWSAAGEYEDLFPTKAPASATPASTTPLSAVPPSTPSLSTLPSVAAQAGPPASAVRTNNPMGMPPQAKAPEKAPAASRMHTDDTSPMLKWVLVWSAAAVIVVLPVLLYFLIWRNSWETSHRQAILDLNSQAQSLAVEGKTKEAYSKYQDLFQLIGDHPIQSGELHSVVESARDSEQTLYAQLLASDQQGHKSAVRTDTRPATLPAATPPSPPVEVVENLTTEQIVSRFDKSVALVRTPTGVGTAFVVGPGMLMTNYHVVADTPLDSIQIYFPTSGNKDAISVTNVLYEDPARDLVVLGVQSSEPPLSLAERGDYRKGQTVTVIGNPGVGNDLILENAVSVGVMSTKATIGGKDFYQLSIAINPGNSGGPVFNSNGQVVGVVTLRAVDNQNIAFCIILDDLRSAVVAAKAQTKDAAAQCTSTHNLRAVYFRTEKIGAIYAQAMDMYTKAMEEAISAGHSATDGVAAASSAIHDKVSQANEFFTDDVKKVVDLVGSDPLIPEATRLQMVDLWSNYNQMKKYVDDPHGTYESYVAKTTELRDRRQQLIESLRVLLGVMEFDDD